MSDTSIFQLKHTFSITLKPISCGACLAKAEMPCESQREVPNNNLLGMSGYRDYTIPRVHY